jgi:hypothetical protein
MPELPGTDVYVASLERRILGTVLNRLNLNNPFLLRTAVRRMGRASSSAWKMIFTSSSI